MPTMKPVTEIILHVTQEHIDRARRLQRDLRFDEVSDIWVCPIALAAREFFQRPIMVLADVCRVFDEGTNEYTIYYHDQAAWIRRFDSFIDSYSCQPTTVILEREPFP